MEQNISPFSPRQNSSQSRGSYESSPDVVNLGMYRLKKSLQKEGFEIVEDHKGKITLVVRVSR